MYKNDFNLSFQCGLHSSRALKYPSGGLRPIALRAKKEQRQSFLYTLLALVISLSLAVVVFAQGGEASVARGGNASTTQIPSLLSKATKQIDLTTYGSLVSNQPWLTDQAVIIHKGDTFFRYDLAAKKGQPLMALTHQFNAASDCGGTLQCSSTGRQMLWSAPGTNYFVSDVQDALEHRWHSASDLSSAQWCADGHHWAELRVTGSGVGRDARVRPIQIIIHNADHPNVNRSFAALPTAMTGLEILTVTSPHQVIARTPDSATVKPVLHSGGGDFIISHTLRSTQQISVWSLTQRRMVQHWTVHLPDAASEVVVSPQGNRIAWLIAPLTHASMVDMVQEQLWVSGLDGNGLHLIGMFSKSIPPTNMEMLRKLILQGDTSYSALAKRFSDLVMPSQVQWLPSGKKLSFVYQGTLWTVPAN